MIRCTETLSVCNERHGTLVLSDSIEGMRFYQSSSARSMSGHVTELWRAEWLGRDTRPDHIVFVTMAPHATTNWHCHHQTMNDQPFTYEDPDDWRLPVDNGQPPRPFDR